MTTKQLLEFRPFASNVYYYKPITLNYGFKLILGVSVFSTYIVDIADGLNRVKFDKYCDSKTGNRII